MRKSGLITVVLLLGVGSSSPLVAQELPVRYAATAFQAQAEPLESSRRLFAVPKGAEVQLLKCRREWCQITFDGRPGWTLTRYLSTETPDGLTPTPPSPAPAPPVAPRAAVPVKRNQPSEETTPSTLTASQRAEIRSIGRELASSRSFEAMRAHWEEYVRAWADSRVGEAEVERLVQMILREAYLETDKDLQFYAEKVRYFNDREQLIRDELDRVRRHLPSVLGTPEENEAYLRQLERELAQVQGDARVASTELEEKQQQQQQTLQTISNASKMLHDTAMAVIRKIG